MKRKDLGIRTAILAICMSMLVGCGNTEEENAEENTVVNEQETVTEISAEEEETADESAEEEASAEEAAPQVLFSREEQDWYDEESGKWALHLEYTGVEIQGEGFETAAESIRRWSEQRAEELLSYGEGLSAAAVEEAALSDAAGTDSYYYSIFEELETMRADSRVISLREMNSDYTGGAHGNYGYTGIVFDAQTGEQLTLEDILTDADGFRQEATAYITEELQLRYEDGLFPEYERTVENMWENGPVWYLDAAGITFVFNPYEVGPYAMGAAEVTLPYDEFAAYIKDSYAGVSGAGTAVLPENKDTYLTLSAEDSAQTRLCVRTESDEYGECRISLELGESSITAGTFGRIGGAYLLNLPDGRSFVVLDADYASDDYVTFIYEITGGVIKEGNRLEGVSLQGGSVNTDLLTLRMSLYVFGTYYGKMDYVIDENGNLAQQSDVFEVFGNDSEAYLLTVIQDLPVMIDGQTEMLAAGTQVRLTGTDDQGTAYFRVEETGEEASVSYTRGDGAEDTWTLYVDGKPETYYFEMLPYAG